MEKKLKTDSTFGETQLDVTQYRSTEYGTSREEKHSANLIKDEENLSGRAVAPEPRAGKFDAIQAEFMDQTIPFQVCPPTPQHNPLLIATMPDLV